MDPIKIEKIQAINRYRKQLLLNHLFLYSLTAISTCSLFCSTSFLYPPLFSCMKVFLFVSLPPQISSMFFSSKFFFIFGNLIVIFLVGESKMFFTSGSSFSSDVYYDKCVNRSRSLRCLFPLDKKEEAKLDKYFEEKDRSITSRGGEEKGGWREMKVDVDDEDLDREVGVGLAAEELNKRADDFIARVIKQRRLEATLLIYSDE